jgi:hypothetical protein
MFAVSHPVGSPAVKVTGALSPFSVPPPTLVTATVCAAGLAPPCVALKLLLVLANPIVGPAPTVNVTLMIWGLLFATAEVTATFAV